MRSGRRDSIPATRIVIAAVLAVSVIFALVAAGLALDKRVGRSEQRTHYDEGDYTDSVMIDGRRYLRKNRVTTLLLMGVDKRQNSKLSIGYRDGAQADFLRLIVIDRDTKQVSQMQIDRDTMAQITILGVLGDVSSERTAQISLQHGFGDGKELSCELTVQAVSELLFGTPIDSYVALNMNGITALNDAVGGVEVTLEDDFTQFDSKMKQGTTLTLHGMQAEYFVRERMTVGVGTNEARMERQEQFLEGFMKAAEHRISIDKNAFDALVDAINPYLTMNLGRSKLISLLWEIRDYSYMPVLKPDGTHEIGSDGFMEFYPDEDQLKQILLDTVFRAA